MHVISNLLDEKDCLMVGFDQIKDENIIHNAYNIDVNRDFIINYLAVMNKNLEANFNLDDF